MQPNLQSKNPSRLPEESQPMAEFRREVFSHLDQFDEVCRSIRAGWDTGYLSAIAPHRPSSLVSPVLSELITILDGIIELSSKSFTGNTQQFKDNLKSVTGKFAILHSYEDAWDARSVWKGGAGGSLEDLGTVKLVRSVASLSTKLSMLSSVTGKSADQVLLEVKKDAAKAKEVTQDLIDYLKDG